jgi:hypothetical protein
MRSCTKKTPPGDVSRTPAAMIANDGASTSRRSEATATSSAHLKNIGTGCAAPWKTVNVCSASAARDDSKRSVGKRTVTPSFSHMSTSFCCSR